MPVVGFTGQLEFLQSHASPSQPLSHSQVPQLQVPWPEQSPGQGCEEQLQNGPLQPARHEQEPQLQIPCDGPEQLPAGVAGQPPVEQKQSMPRKVGLHLHWPHSHTPLPLQLPLPGHGSDEQLQLAPCQPALHSQEPHTHWPLRHGGLQGLYTSQGQSSPV